MAAGDTIQGSAVPADPKPVEEWIGRVIDERYRVERTLGEGAMGAVFVAWHLKLNKHVALKIIHPDLAGRGDIAARFAREAMASAQIEHPHVATTLDYGTLPEGGAYLVMQLGQGRLLRNLMREGSLSWRLACQAAAQVADAIHAAHNAGIVHRDLKPDNILIEIREDGSPWVKVLDFGIARITKRGTLAYEKDESPTLTRVGTVMGTPGYMSPEQATGGTVNESSDLYSLGVVIWEMITGRSLFDERELSEIVAKQLTEQVPKLKGIGTPVELDDLIEKLLAPKSVDRPANANEVKEELQRIAELASTKPNPFVLPALSKLVHSPKLWTAGGVFAAIAGFVLLLQLGTDNGEPTRPAPKQQTVPPEVKQHIDTLLHAKHNQRQKAATWIQHHYSDHVPAYAHAVAKLELARGCKNRRSALKTIRELGDPKALPAVQRLHRAPKDGCGFLSLSDCHECIRAELRKTMSALRKRK